MSTHKEGLSLSVVTASAPLSVFADSLSADEAWFGLPEEFAPAVLEGLRSGAKRQPVLPSASLTCALAACTDIGSTNAIFRSLGHAVAHLLLTSKEVEQAEIASLLTLDGYAGI